MLLIGLLLLLAVSGGGVTRAEWRGGCPAACLCDLEASIVSCAGPSSDEDGEERLVNANATTAVDVAVWTMAGMVQRLDLKDLNLTKLETGHLNRTALKELSVVRCGTSDIGQNTFSGQDQLERLDLSQNALVVLTQV